MAATVFQSKVYSKEELCVLEHKADPCGVIIFGASGDLTQRKLLPALFELAERGLMPPSYYILGVARTPMTDQEFREKVKQSVGPQTNADVLKTFLERCHYLSGDYDTDKTYRDLGGVMADLETRYRITCRRVFYLSTPPNVYSGIIDKLGQSGLAKRPEDRAACVRVIIEKPFGSSQASAVELNARIIRVLHESQIYRIDHYLGKESVQNILMFRFANIMFEPIWNRRYIDHVQITASEQLGVEHRAGYYEQAGVVRDMIQNHLLQLLTVIAMEAPSSMESEAVRDQKISVLKCIKSLTEKDVDQNSVLAQYGDGAIDGEAAIAYRREKGVNPQSVKATFAAMKFEIDNWRWQGVPFYLRSGKRMAKRMVEIAVHFKRVPTSIFKPLDASQLSPNVLKFRIQPDEGISMNFESKHPGPKLCMSTVMMEFGYQGTFGTKSPDPYARLFLDAMVGDQTLFARSDGVEEAWRVVDPVLKYWESQQPQNIITYPSGSWGPKEADAIMARSGRSWDN